MEEVAGSIPVGSTSRSPDASVTLGRMSIGAPPILAGDVGGTKTLLRLVGPGDEKLLQTRFESATQGSPSPWGVRYRPWMTDPGQACWRLPREQPPLLP